MKYMVMVVSILISICLALSTTHAAPASSFVKITGLSMYPTYEDGQVVACDNLSEHNIGDVVVYQTPKSNVVHRIIGKIFNFFIMKGDNNSLPDFRLVSEKKIVCSVDNETAVPTL